MTRNSATELNLDEYAQKQKWELKVVSEEHQDDRRFRHKQQDADAKMKRLREGALLGVAVTFIIALATNCMAISLSQATSADDKKWAWGTLTLITGAVLGYLFGKAAAAANK